MSKHHSHEISDHPEVQWALDLLKPDPTHELSFLSTYSTELGCTTVSFSVSLFYNMFNNRPWNAAIPRHITFAVAGYLLSHIAKKLVDDFQAERDAKLRDYIIQHPELFPEPERIKYKQVFNTWRPIR